MILLTILVALIVLRLIWRLLTKVLKIVVLVGIVVALFYMFHQGAMPTRASLTDHFTAVAAVSYRH